MSEPIITLGEYGEFDEDGDGNIVLRNTRTDVDLALSEVVALDDDTISAADVLNTVDTETNVGISHRYFFGPADPLDDPDIEVREGDVWYDTSDLG